MQQCADKVTRIITRVTSGVETPQPRAIFAGEQELVRLATIILSVQRHKTVAANEFVENAAACPYVASLITRILQLLWRHVQNSATAIQELTWRTIAS